MTTEAGTLDLLLLGILPYVAFFTFFLETVRRYRQQAFTYSSLSSQFLENEQHFWSLVPFHYGIIVVLTGHVVAWLLPRQVLAWNSHPLRLYVLEVSLLVCGILALLGFVNAVIRRLSYPKIKTVTTASDWVLAAILSSRWRPGCTSLCSTPGDRRGLRRQWRRISGRSCGWRPTSVRSPRCPSPSSYTSSTPTS